MRVALLFIGMWIGLCAHAAENYDRVLVLVGPPANGVQAVDPLALDSIVESVKAARIPYEVIGSIRNGASREELQSRLRMIGGGKKTLVLAFFHGGVVEGKHAISNFVDIEEKRVMWFFTDEVVKKREAILTDQLFEYLSTAQAQPEKMDLILTSCQGGVCATDFETRFGPSERLMVFSGRGEKTSVTAGLRLPQTIRGILSGESSFEETLEQFRKSGFTSARIVTGSKACAAQFGAFVSKTDAK